MTESIVDLSVSGAVATLTMNDGKKNALSPRMFAALNAALDRAEEARAVVLLTGQPGIFSAGFDLSVLKGGGRAALGMLRDGVALSERLLTFPFPVVMACGGHAIAMAAFVLLCGDYRFGVPGAFKVVANEVAIGLPVPRVATEICRQRLSPQHLPRALLLSEAFDPEGAVAAGFLDRLVAPEDLVTTAHAHALALSKLDMRAYAISKRRLRADTLAAIQSGARRDLADFVLEGARRLIARP